MRKSLVRARSREALLRKSGTDARNPSVPIFALSFLSLSLFLSSSRPFEGRVHALGRWTAFLSENHSGMIGAVVSGEWLRATVRKSLVRARSRAALLRKSGTDARNPSVPIFAAHRSLPFRRTGLPVLSKFGSIAREAEPASPCSRIAIRARFRFPLQHRSRRIRRSAGLMGSGFRDNRGGLSSRPHA